MRLFRRRSAGSDRDAALDEARRAAARMRREKSKMERYRSRKQQSPATDTTTHQWLGGGS